MAEPDPAGPRPPWAGRELLASRMQGFGSTIFGEGVDSLIFYPLAFLGVWPASLVLTVMGSNYLIKVGWETLMTPFTYKIVGWLKRAEQEDYFDRTTDFNPFTLKT